MKTKPKLTRDEIEALARAAIVSHEFEWWKEGLTLSEAHRRLKGLIGHTVGRKYVSTLLPSCCVWFGKIRRGNRADSTSLTGKEWERLAGVVISMADELRGVGIDAAVAIVSTVVRTNAAQLRGLNPERHYWEKDELLTNGPPINWPPKPSARILESASLE